MTDSGSNASNQSPDPDGSPTPWWKKPFVIAIGSAVVITVVTGWAGQGASAIWNAAFGGEKPNRPTVTVTAQDEPFCTPWLLSMKPDLVAEELKTELQGVTEVYGEKLVKALQNAKETSGSKIATGDRVEVTIEGPKEKVVILESLEPNVTKRSKLGETMYVGDQCGGGLPERFFKSNLDDPKPEFSLAHVDDNGEEVTEPIDFPYKISSAEPEKFVLTGQTKASVEWTATLHWIADGKKGKTEISDNGSPFVSFSLMSASADFNTTSRDLKIVK